MQIERLKVFIDVAECLSFTRAAERGFISQSAVSQQIAALEKELGVQLLLRDRKGNVSLTPEGETFYKGCVHVVQSYEKTLLQVKNMRKGDRELIVLGLVAGTSNRWLPEVVQQFSRSFPNVRVKPTYDSFGGLRKALESGRCDAAVAIEYGLTDLPDVRYETLCTVEPMLLVSRAHRLAGRTAVTARELVDERFVTIAREYAADSFRHWMEERRREGMELKHVETVESVEAQRTMVELNAAVAILPLLPVHDQFDPEKYCAIRLMDTHERVRYVFAYRTEADGEAMQQLLLLIRAQYQSDGA